MWVSTIIRESKVAKYCMLDFQQSKPSGAGTGILRDKYVDTMTAVAPFTNMV